MKKTSKKTKKKKASRIINIVLIVVCVCVLIFAGYKLISIYLDFKNNKEQVSEAKEAAFADDEEEEDDDGYDYDALLAINSDIVAWIRMQGDSSGDLDNPIDYPVVQYSDNNYYLRRALDGTYSNYGTLFVDYRMSLNNNFCIIWGHNIKNPDDMMFGYLNYYEDEEFYEKYAYYDVWIGYDYYTYKVFACGEVEVDDFFFAYSFTSSYTFSDWLDDCFSSLTIYDVSRSDFDDSDNVLALVCCVYPTDYSKRYVLLLYRED